MVLEVEQDSPRVARIPAFALLPEQRSFQITGCGSIRSIRRRFSPLLPPSSSQMTTS
jgi:hypothetical protein